MMQTSGADVTQQLLEVFIGYDLCGSAHRIITPALDARRFAGSYHLPCSGYVRNPRRRVETKPRPTRGRRLATANKVRTHAEPG